MVRASRPLPSVMGCRVMNHKWASPARRSPFMPTGGWLNQARKASSSGSSTSRPGASKWMTSGVPMARPTVATTMGSLPRSSPAGRVCNPSGTPRGKMLRCQAKSRSRLSGSTQPSAASARISTMGSILLAFPALWARFAATPRRSIMEARMDSRSRVTPSIALLLTTSWAMAPTAASLAASPPMAFTTPSNSAWERRAESKGPARTSRFQWKRGQSGRSQMNACFWVALAIGTPP